MDQSGNYDDGTFNVIRMYRSNKLFSELLIDYKHNFHEIEINVENSSRNPCIFVFNENQNITKSETVIMLYPYENTIYSSMSSMLTTILDRTKIQQRYFIMVDMIYVGYFMITMKQSRRFRRGIRHFFRNHELTPNSTRSMQDRRNGIGVTKLLCVCAMFEKPSWIDYGW